MDKQCTSCGGFCKKSGCERENVQPEQEPVALRNAVFTVLEGFTLPQDVRKILETAYFKTTPPQRTWVGLMDEDCKGMSAGDKAVAMWADRTLKEKNNG